MDARRDALAGAAEWIGRVEQHAAATRGLVATVGRVEVAPGAGNVIPGLCRVSLDVRHADDVVRVTARDRLQDAAREIAARRGLAMEWEPRLDQPAVQMSGTLVTALARACERSGTEAAVLTSGAGHDAMVLAGCMPAAMLMLRSPGGLSHHPDESVTEDDVAAALAVGALFLDDLARGSGD
jgi:allantoate deiminase